MNTEKPPGGREAAKCFILSQACVSRAFTIWVTVFSGVKSTRFPRLTDKRVSERGRRGLFRNNISRTPFGERMAAVRSRKTGEAPPSRTDRAAEISARVTGRKIAAMCRKWVTGRKNSVMIEPIGGFCYGNDKKKETKKIAQKKRSADAGHICADSTDSGRRAVRVPV